MSDDAARLETRNSKLETFLDFLRLGCTSFGGPVAHLGIYRAEFVERRRLLTDQEYAGMVALAQVAPGPTSSQVGFAIGMHRAGWLGGIAAFVGFTLPSAVIMGLAAAGLALWGGQLGYGWRLGIAAAAAAVVIQALWGMARSLTPDAPRLSLAVAAAGLALALPGIGGQFAALGLGLIGGCLLRHQPSPVTPGPRPLQALPLALVGTALIAAAVVALALAARWQPAPIVIATDACAQAGALVFGGGHVVLPILADRLVASGDIHGQTLIAGYGLAQAMPGPLFTLSTFVGTTLAGWAGAITCTLAIFAPGLLLMACWRPAWGVIAGSSAWRRPLDGVNAAVTGLLLAALYDPVLRHALPTASGFVILAAAAVALIAWKLPPWVVVPLGAIAGACVG